MTKGKCLDCKKAFEWKGSPRLRDAHCPFCGRLLIATTWELGSGENREGYSNIFHPENYEQQRYAIFKKYGFETFFVKWEEVFQDKYGKRTQDNWEQNILGKINNFMRC